MCNVAREGLGEKSMRSFLVSRLTVITLGGIYCSRRGLLQYLIGESGLRNKYICEYQGRFSCKTGYEGFL